LETTLTGGDLPLLLSMAPDAGVRSLPTDPQMVDEALLMNAQTTHGSGVRLLRLGRSSPLRSGAEPAVLARVLELMERWHDWIVVDCGCVTEQIARVVIPRASTVLLVATLALPAAQRAKQWVETLIDIGVPRGKLLVVMNRCRDDETAYRQQVPSVFPCRIGAYLPDAPEQVRDALLEGVPLVGVDARGGLARGYEELAVALGGSSAEASDRKPHGLLQRVQARFMRMRHAT
jgi:Flp pilus assembly CpaE family ATPase